MITSGGVFDRSNPTKQQTQKPTSEQNKIGGDKEFQFVMVIKSGIGLSLVNRDPAEELLYAFFSNVVIDYQSSRLQKILDGSIQNIQIDNQLSNCQVPVVLFLSPSNKSDDHR